MTLFAKPSEEKAFLAGHVSILRTSFLHWTGQHLVDPRMLDVEASRYLFTAPFVVVSHDTAKDPIFNYGNQTALTLFGLRGRIVATHQIRNTRNAARVCLTGGKRINGV